LSEWHLGAPDCGAAFFTFLHNSSLEFLRQTVAPAKSRVTPGVCAARLMRLF